MPTPDIVNPQASPKVMMHTMYLPERTDGASHSAHALVTHLRKGKVPVTVCTTDYFWDPRMASHARAEGLSIFRSWLGPLEFSPGLLCYLSQQIAGHDVVHFRGIYSLGTVLGSVLSQFLGRPYIVSPLGNYIPNWTERKTVKSGTAKYLFFHLLAQPVLRNAFRIACASETEREHLEERLLGGRYSVIPNGVDVSTYSDAVSRSEFDKIGIGAKQEVFLFLGNLSWVKGLDFLLDTWEIVSQQLPSAVLVIAGSAGTDRQFEADLRRRIHRLVLPASVIIPGPVQGRLKSALLQHSVCLLFPSRRESFGNVVLEALASGTPVLASNGTPWSCLEDEGLGRWLPHDIATWAMAMVAISKAHIDRDQFRRSSKGWLARNFDWDVVAAKYLALYSQACSKP